MDNFLTTKIYNIIRECLPNEFKDYFSEDIDVSDEIINNFVEDLIIDIQDNLD